MQRFCANYCGSKLLIESDHADVVRFARLYLQAFEIVDIDESDSETADGASVLRCTAVAAGQYRVSSPQGEGLHDDLDCMAVVDMAMRHWLAMALAVREELRAYHAAAVVIADRVWAIGGPSGAGKSTLALACHGMGWPVLSDEYTLCTLTTAAAIVEPYPRPWDVLHTDLDPHVSRGAQACEAIGYPVRRPHGSVVPSTYWVPRSGFCLRRDYPFGGWVLLDREGPVLEELGEDTLLPAGLRYPVYRLGRADTGTMLRELERLG